MQLEFNREQLLELMKDFHTLSGIRMVLFDDEYRELLSFPEQPCKFCRMLKSKEETRQLCSASDKHAFQEAKAKHKLILFHCHAGLMEAAIPLEDNHVTIGYLMFGQISDIADKQELRRLLHSTISQYDLPESDDLFDEIPRKTREQIQAAAKIMEACTHYALLSQAVGRKRLQFSRRLHAFLLAHLQEDLQAQDIADAFEISRSKLYQQCSQYLGMGVGEYLNKLRMEQAQLLLRSTHLSITEISGQVGFSDYNYFCRVFRKTVGLSPQKYRTTHS